MKSTSKPYRISFNASFFAKTLFLWIAGVLLNFLPSIFKAARQWLDAHGNLDICLCLWSDFDLLCIFFTITFLIFLEFILTRKQKLTKADKICILFLIGLGIVFVVLYAITVFYQGIDTVVSKEQMRWFNASAFFVVFVLGTVNCIRASLERKRRKG